MSQLYCWDFTISDEAGKTGDNGNNYFDEIIISIKKLSKHWGYQKEIGKETGYVHWQGRISLIKKLRMCELIKLFPIKGKWSPTSDGCKSGDAFYEYTTKEDTRVEGPWTDRDIAKYIPRQIREVNELYPWQNFVIEKINLWDSRHIDIIVDKQGCKGKSTLVGYCCCNGLARKVPALNNFKEIINMVMCMPVSKAYFIDMPRALDKSKQGEFYSAIESIKDGHLWDNRYTYKEKWIDSPNIWIFTNVPVNKSLLSRDRWREWKITEDNNIVRV